MQKTCCSEKLKGRIPPTPSPISSIEFLRNRMNEKNIIENSLNPLLIWLTILSC